MVTWLSVLCFADLIVVISRARRAQIAGHVIVQPRSFDSWGM